MSYNVANNSPSTTITTAVNLVQNGTMQFMRIGGQYYLSFTDNSNNILWQVVANGGVPSLSNGYLGYSYDPKVNYNLNAIRGCTVAFNSLNNYTITTTGGDIYNIIFSPYPGIPVTFTQLSAAPTVGSMVMTYFRCSC